MLRDLLLVLNILVCVAMIGVVLMQRSEGGAFGTGGPTGLVTARGAGDLLTRTTWVLFSLFLALSLALTLLGGHERSSQAILQRLKNVTVNPDLLNRPPPPTPGATTPGSPAGQAAPLSNAMPAQSGPPALALPPLGGAPVPKAGRQPARHAARPVSQVKMAVPAAPDISGATSLALPPIDSGTSAPSAPAAPTQSPPKSDTKQGASTPN